MKNKYICKDCAPLFSGEWLKTAFYFTKKELKKLKQNEFEDLIFNNNLEFPCVLSFSESRKKHRLFRSKISYNNKGIYVSTDFGMVAINLKKDIKLFKNLKKMYQWNFSKEMIKNGNYNSGFLKKFNVPLLDFLLCESQLRAHRGSLKFNLLLNFINK